MQVGWVCALVLSSFGMLSAVQRAYGLNIRDMTSHKSDMDEAWQRESTCSHTQSFLKHSHSVKKRYVSPKAVPHRVSSPCAPSRSC